MLVLKKVSLGILIWRVIFLCFHGEKRERLDILYIVLNYTKKLILGLAVFIILVFIVKKSRIDTYLSKTLLLILLGPECLLVKLGKTLILLVLPTVTPLTGTPTSSASMLMFHLEFNLQGLVTLP